MKIIPGKYSEEKGWQPWISFANGPAINRVFLYRIAAYIRDVVKTQKTKITVGFRTIAEQQILYDLYIAGKGNKASKPGESWHNFALAIDIMKLATGKYPGTIDADYALWQASKPELLNRYGLCHSTKGEPWHIIPIECKAYTGERCWFSDLDDLVNTTTGYLDVEVTSPQTKGNAIIFAQKTINLTRTVKMKEDGQYGSGSQDAVELYQTLKKIAVTGKLDQATWAAIVKDTSAPDYKALYTKEVAKTAALQKHCTDSDNQIAELTVVITSNKTQVATLKKKISSAITSLQ